MSDEELVKRLRNPIRFASETQQQAKDRHFVERHTAAARIEALQAERDDLRSQLMVKRVEAESGFALARQQKARIAQLEAELAAAREALERIALNTTEVFDEDLDDLVTVSMGAVELEEIARAALKDHPHD